jgi:hypothetical protein
MTLLMKTQEAWMRAKYLPQTILSGFHTPYWVSVSHQGVVLQKSGALESPTASRPLQGQDVDSLWNSAADELFKLCDQAHIEHKRIHILFSDVWFKPLVVSIKHQSAQDSEMEMLLQGQYQRVYGDLCKGWAYAWDACGSHLVAMASPQHGIDQIRRGLAQRHIQLAGLSPISAQYLRSAPDPAMDGWMAILQSDSFSLLRIDKQEVCDWRTFPVTSSLFDDLLIHLSRQSARASDNSRFLEIVDLTQTMDQSFFLDGLMKLGWQSQFTNLMALKRNSSANWLHLLDVKHR